ncbi:HNH endonuclease [Phenylobacterium sp. VNQ135]|uniref:HNH endonuclease n=1 Tax=Phenylobacterium sp. VNQ135 TaxID=3400922 RepID=UPI003BFED406
MPKGKNKRRVRLAEAQNWRCAYCSGEMHEDGARLDGATIEHLVPLVHGGSRDRENLVAACLACNNARSGFFSARIFFRIRRWQLRKGRWPCCTFPDKKVRKLMRRIFAEAEAAREAKLRDRLDVVLSTAAAPQPGALRGSPRSKGSDETSGSAAGEGFPPPPEASIANTNFPVEDGAGASRQTVNVG